MDPIDWIYVGLAFIFACVMTYMFVYNTRIEPRRAALRKKGRLPITREEGIAIATEAHEHPNVNMP